MREYTQFIHDDVTLTVALSEIESTREFLILGNAQAATRFNYYLVLASAGFAGSAALISSEYISSSLHSIILPTVAAIVLVIGLLTFERIAQSDVTRLEYLTMINLYRGFLLTRAPELRPYTILPAQLPGEPSPRWKVQSALNNLAITTAVINSVAAAVTAGTIAQELVNNVTLTLTVASAVFAFVSLGQGVWLRGSHTRGRANIDRLLGIEAARQDGTLAGPH